jgi:hypothetical protein
VLGGAGRCTLSDGAAYFAMGVVGLGSAAVLCCEVLVDVEDRVEGERLGFHFVGRSCSGWMDWGWKVGKGGRALCHQVPELLMGGASKGGSGFIVRGRVRSFIAYCFSAGGFSMAMLRVLAVWHLGFGGLVLANLDSACI